MTDYKSVSDTESVDQTHLRDIDPKVVNNVVSNVFFLVTLQMSIYYGELIVFFRRRALDRGPVSCVSQL